MILGQLPILLLLARILDTAVLSPLPGLEKEMSDLSIKRSLSAPEIRTRQYQSIIQKLSMPQLTLDGFTEQERISSASTLQSNIKTVVKKLNATLSEFLALGVEPLEAATIIKDFFSDEKELALIAREEGAYTLLGLLQGSFLWRDETQFHWFQAQSYHSSWYNKPLWNTRKMDWRSNLLAVCEWDNGDLAKKIRKNIRSSGILKNLNEEILVLCAKYDAIRVFKSTEMDPIRLEPHLGILAAFGSIKLLRLYQMSKKSQHLNLEKYSLPKELPANASDFLFFWKNGYNYFPVSKFIETFCEKGRLDLLQLLHRLDRKLVPTERELALAAKKGWLTIIQWSHQLSPFSRMFLETIASYLAINRHLQAFDEWTKLNKITISEQMIEDIAGQGALEALILINKIQPIKQGRYSWANLAAMGRHHQLLKWLYKNFSLLPSVYSLQKATVEMLTWIQGVDSSLIGADLVQFGAGNFELLKWVYEHPQGSILVEKKKALSEKVCSKEMMVWLYTKLEVCPSNMSWAYTAGDLGAIEWAFNNCKVMPTLKNTCIAAKQEHLHIIRWIHKNSPEHLLKTRTLKCAIEYGSLRIANYIMSNFAVEERFNVTIDCGFRADQRLNVLMWVHEHKFGMDFSHEILLAVFRGDLQALKWFVETFPAVKLPFEAWSESAKHGHHEIYKWLLKNYPKEGTPKTDILDAFSNGYLKVVKVILQKDSSLVEKLSRLDTTRRNYHIKQWVAANYGLWVNW